MPNGDDTIRVQLPDGRTGTIPKSSLAKAQRKGWKIVDTPFVAGAKTFGREAALGAASGLGIAESTHPLQDTLKNAITPQGPTGENIASAILGPGFDVAKGLAGSTGEIASGLGADPEHPASFGPVDIGKVGHGAGSLATQILTLMMGGRAGETGEGAGIGKKAVRSSFGAGEGDVRIKTEKILAEQKEAEQAHQEKVQKVQADSEAKLQKVKEKTAEKIGKVLQDRVQASAKETAAQVKKDALAKKQGPVYQRMNEMAEDAQKHITQMEQKVNQAETVKWEVFKKHIGDAPVKTSGVADAISNAEQKILTGQSLPIFKQVMSELPGEDADLAKMLATMNPDVAARSGLPDIGISLDTARKLYTKIGQKIGGSELPRDVYRALYQVQDAIDKNIAEAIAKKGGADALRDYRNLQADWKKYRQTFSDKDSPLRKIMEAKDPNTRRTPITSETGARAIEYLGRYRDMGADPSKLGKIQALDKALKGVSGTGAKAPEKVSGIKLPEKPELPAPPETESTVPADVRKKILQQKATAFSQPLSKWEMMNPKLLIFRKLMKGLIQNPKFVDWLSQ